MNKLLAAVALALTATVVPASAQGPEGHGHGPSPEMQAFCSQHQPECAQLRTLHETAKQTCQNKDETVGDCKAAREAVREQMQKMEGEGMPAPMRGGMGGHGPN